MTAITRPEGRIVGINLYVMIEAFRTYGIVFRKPFRDPSEATLAELEEPHQRPDPGVECPGSDPGWKIRPWYLSKDLRSQPLLTSELLDRVLRWRSPLQSSGTPGR